MNNKSQTLTPTQLSELLTNLPPGHKIEITKTPEGDVIMSQDKTKAQLIEEKYVDLIGHGISLSEAAKKYDVPRGAIEGWVYQAHYVNFVDEESYPKLINEAEVALMVDLYRQRKADGITGRVPFFDEAGVPILERKHPDLAEYRRRKRET